MDKFYCRRKNTCETKIEGKTYVLSPDHKYLLELNKVGNFLWSCLKKKTALSDLVKKITSHYRISLSQRTSITKDVEQFLTKLKKRRLISESSS